ncbi:putative bacterial virulence factor [compost metagenome]
MFRAAPAPALGELPVLEARPVHQALVFLGDWLSGLTLMTIENAGHSEGREISIEQNERLGLILKNIQSDKR